MSGRDARLEALATATGQAVVGMDANGNIVEWAGKAAQIFGWEREEVLGRCLADTFIPAFYRAAHRHGVERQRTGAGGPLLGRLVELSALRRDGTEFPVEMLVIPDEDGDGRRVFTALLRDITARKQLERLGSMQLAVSQLLVSGTGSGLAGVLPEVLGAVGETLRCEVVLTWVSDPGSGLRLECAWHAQTPGLDALCERAGSVPLPQVDLVGRMLSTGAPFVVHAEMAQRNPLLALAGEFGLSWMATFPIAHAGPPSGLLVLLSSGILALDEDVLRAMSNVGGQLGQAYAREDAERVARESERDLWRQAFHDQLTGLANRALFTDRVDHALLRSSRHGTTCAILLLDLDDFKRVNDTRGHQVGDLLVQAVAERLCEHLRPEDSVARLGGDEFAVLLEDIDGPRSAEIAAERVLEALQLPFHIDGRELLVSASVGVAVSDDGTTFDEILRNADLAMYVAKSRGKGRHQRFEQRMLSAMVERVTLEHEMRTALTRDQLTVLYQPQIDVATGRITGAEALVRWDHPTRGRLEPHAFIPQAEESRLIGALGARVLRTACWAARRWLDEGLPVMRVAVNVSGRELETGELQGRIRSVLAETLLPASCLELEITETSAVGQHREALARLAELRTMGVRIAIDDFGTGYSMLSRLQAFPVDRLKIDRSFIEAIILATDAAPLVAAMIGMAHGLGLTVVAEGVEVPEQLHYLATHGCDEAQGYLIGRPVTAEAFETLLRRSAAGMSTVHWEEPELGARGLLSEMVRAAPEVDSLVPALLDQLQRITGVRCDLLDSPPDPEQPSVPVALPDGRLMGWLGVTGGADDRALEVMRLFSRVIAEQLA